MRRVEVERLKSGTRFLTSHSNEILAVGVWVDAEGSDAIVVGDDGKEYVFDKNERVRVVEQ
jgi:hypothetical protein